MAIEAIAAIGSQSELVNAPGIVSAPAGTSSFSQMLLDGIGSVDRKIADADQLVRTFAVDDSIPLHQVTFALEEARMSLELMVQVRSRMVESYQRIMEMQL